MFMRPARLGQAGAILLAFTVLAAGSAEARISSSCTSTTACTAVGFYLSGGTTNEPSVLLAADACGAVLVGGTLGARCA
jgi:hypothetical protein